MKFFCPFCDGVLLTDLPVQCNIEGLCPHCNCTFNIDACKTEILEDGEIIPAEPGYAEKMAHFYGVTLDPERRAAWSTPKRSYEQR
jgi:hypothetical protein